MNDFFSLADLSVTGIAADIAGAVILALGFSFKRPERMREEVPLIVQAPTTPGSIGIPFPQAQVESMARQRAEARWGMILLVAGFVMQALVYFFVPSRHLTGGRERLGALVLVAVVWLSAYVGMTLYVPASEWTTRAKLPTGSTASGPVKLYFGEHLEMRGDRQVDVALLPEPPLMVRVLYRLGLRRDD